ncbi:DNA polymerase III subunit alpha [Cohnella sp. CFH 77786]|uniref:DNA polymerase III subunit alpha n=1 Tax=Cohnella sp. CFH 77786 TaxID=2662265 RepID=UPI001C6108B2|nr:DNA polymerase III subunit alpha [Cohnella sp. CFH 77786]
MQEQPVADFVHLHVHTEYSLMEAACKLEDLIDRARAWNMQALAITDKGAVHGALRFYEIARRHGIRPITGCEIKDGETGDTLLALAATNQGWRSIIEHLNGAAFLTPVSQGDVIVLSGGRTGAIHRLIASGRMDEAEKQALANVDRFGKDNFYLEVQHHGFPDDEACVQRTAELSRRTGIPLVATHDVHYASPEDAWLLERLRRGSVPPPPADRHAEGPFYLPSPLEMKEKFRRLPEALANTVRIAERIRFRPEPGVCRLPNFRTDNANPPRSPDDELHQRCRDGLVKRLDAGAMKPAEMPDITERLNRELDVIAQRGFSDYFLIVADMVQAARDLGIPAGPGRGSVAGCLAAYLLGITEVNPLRHGLSFERFLSPDRLSMPDIDIDVCQRRRPEILGYLRQRYGPNRTIHVGVLNTLGTRGAVREAGTRLGMPKKHVDVLAKLMPSLSGQGGIRHCLRTLPELRKLPTRQEPFRSLFRLAERIEGMPRHHSAHPSGIVIGDERIASTLPLQPRPNGDLMTTFTKEDIEALGLPKIDLLGLRNLTVIHDTLAAIRERTGTLLATDRIPLDDPDTFRTLGSGNTLGCFQLESMGIRRLMSRMQPQSIADLADLLALYRPGAWQEGIAETYLRRRSGEEGYVIALPAMTPVLAPTYGLILYQEQVMAIAHAVAGYSMGEADLLRRALSSKSIETLSRHQERFVGGASERGISEKEALSVFDFLVRFSGYSFNKAHSVSYAHLSYWTVYLKTHFPVEYMASLLSSNGGYYDRSAYLRELSRMGITLLGPDVNRSGFGFHAEDGGIRAGMDAIHGTGPESVTALLRSRLQEGPFRSFGDLRTRMGPQKIKRPVLEAWILSGACDGLGGNRRHMIAALDEEACLGGTISTQAFRDFDESEKRKAEKTLLGFSPNPSLTEKWRSFSQRYRVVPIESLCRSRDLARIRICGTIVHSRRQPAAGGEYVLVLVVQDHTEMIEAVVYPDTYKTFLYELNPRGILIEGTLRNRDAHRHVVAEKIKAIGG